MIRDALAALVPADVYVISLTNLKQSYATDEAELKKSLAASDEKLSDAERRIQESEHNKDTLDESVTKADKAGATFRRPKEHVLFLEDHLSEQSHQLLEKKCFFKWITRA